MFGAQAVHRGLLIPEVPLMTGANYAGGSEFAAVALWAAPPPLLLIVCVTLLINSRHLVMGAALAPHLRHLPRTRALLLLFLMSDESWALSYADTVKRERAGCGRPFSTGYYAGCGGAIYVAWLSSTATGASVGPLLGDVTAYGFDMAFPAVFLAILAGLWKGARVARPWAVSLAAAALGHLLAPGAWSIVAGALSGIGAAYLWARPA